MRSSDFLILPAKTQNSEVRLVAIEMEDQSFTVYSIPSLPSQEFGLGESDSENGDDRLEDLDESAKTVLLQLLNKSKRKRKASCEIRKKSLKNESKGKKWTHEEILKLIELYEERQCLWMVQDKSYHNKDKREKALAEIATELDATKGEVKAKILNLRSQLGRENTKIRKTTSGQGTDALYKSSWIYWEHLQFLQSSLQPATSKDSLKIQECSSPSSAEVESKIEETPKSIIKSFRRVTEEKKQELLSTCINVLKEPASKENGEKQCHFAMYIAEKLSSFSPRNRAIAEKRIQDIIFDIEMNSYQQSASSFQPGSFENQQIQMQPTSDTQNHTQGPYMTMLN